MLRQISLFGSLGAKVRIVGSLYLRDYSRQLFWGIRFKDLVLGRPFLGLAFLLTYARRFSSRVLISGNCVGNSMFMVSLHQLVCNIGQLHFSASLRNDDVRIHDSSFLRCYVNPSD